MHMYVHIEFLSFLPVFLVYRLKRRVLKQMLLLTVRGRQAESGQPSVQAASTTNTDGGAGDETKPLLSSMFCNLYL